MCLYTATPCYLYTEWWNTLFHWHQSTWKQVVQLVYIELYNEYLKMCGFLQVHREESGQPIKVIWTAVNSVSLLTIKAYYNTLSGYFYSLNDKEYQIQTQKWSRINSCGAFLCSRRDSSASSLSFSGFDWWIKEILCLAQGHCDRNGFSRGVCDIDPEQASTAFSLTAWSDGLPNICSTFSLYYVLLDLSFPFQYFYITCGFQPSFLPQTHYNTCVSPLRQTTVNTVTWALQIWYFNCLHRSDNWS